MLFTYIDGKCLFYMMSLSFLVLFDFVLFKLILLYCIHSYFILNLIRHRCYSAEVLYCYKTLKAQMFWCLGLIAAEPH